MEALLGTAVGLAVRDRMRGRVLPAPAHLDAEVLSALGRLVRAGEMEERSPAVAILCELAVAPVRRHPLSPLRAGAYERRARLRLLDALYVELASALGSVPLLSTDGRLARACTLVDLVAG